MARRTFKPMPDDEYDPDGLLPPTPRMRAAARRRERGAMETLRIGALPSTPTPATPAALIPKPPSLIELQRTSMQAVFANAGISLASFALEVVTVARNAAADGEYAAAANLYKIVGQHIGALAPDAAAKHVHFHQNSEGAASGDLRTTSDDALRSLIAQAKLKREQQALLAAQPTTATVIDTEA